MAMMKKTMTLKKASVTVMTEICNAFSNGFCGCFDEGNEPDDNPSGCDEDGLCTDERDNGCDDYDVDEDVCDECGMTLGFCAPDCTMRGTEDQDDD